MDSKPSWNTLSVVPSNPLLNNVLLLAIFIIQHSVVKKPVNNLILRYFPPGVERSLYTLVSGLLMYAMFLFWIPMTEYTLWTIQTQWLYCAVLGLSLVFYLAFVKIAFGTTFKIEGLDLYGYSSCGDKNNRKLNSEECPANRRPQKVYKDGIYSYVRHPMMASLLYATCISPTMTIGHALWSGSLVIYIVVAVVTYEEPALVEEFGEDYKKYMKEVPGLVPDPRKFLIKSQSEQKA